MNALYNAWIVEYQGSHQGPFDQRALVEAKLAGLQNDRKALESIGLSGAYSNPTTGYRTWDVYQAQWQSALDRAQGGNAQDSLQQNSPR
jgi:hypothetical protein